MKNVYDITNEFEEKLAQYTGAKYTVTLEAPDAKAAFGMSIL